jgi:hypothetical protein
VGNTLNGSVDKSVLSVGKRNGMAESSVARKTLRTGQHVRIDGRDEVYLILRVDKTRHLADLLRQGAVRKVQAGVPLALLSLVDTSTTEAGNAAGAVDDAQLSQQAS